MASRSSREAFQDFLNPLAAAVGCVTQLRLSFERRVSPRDLVLGTNYGLTLRRMEPIRLRGEMSVTMSLGLYFRILEVEDSGGLLATTTQYSYTLATSDGEEILVFHWTPDVAGENAVRFPHLHVGSAVVSNSSQIRPRTFHKVHVPTGYVSMQSVVRLAITEFGVMPLRPDWETVLAEPESNLIR